MRTDGSHCNAAQIFTYTSIYWLHHHDNHNSPTVLDMFEFWGGFGLPNVNRIILNGSTLEVPVEIAVGAICEEFMECSTVQMEQMVAQLVDLSDNTRNRMDNIS